MQRFVPILCFVVTFGACTGRPQTGTAPQATPATTAGDPLTCGDADASTDTRRSGTGRWGPRARSPGV